MTSTRSRWILGGVAVFAIAWAIARAAVQSITIDEAVTYNIFVFNRRFLWYAANNHILNSTLMYGLTKVFGLSQFTVRLPALIGAAFYITAAYRLCRLLGASSLVQLTLFVCLVFNPFIFDHLVAARGYGLALGLLMWAMVYAAQEGFTVAACAVSSVCAGMSVNANFSFAIVNFVVLLAILLCACSKHPKEKFRVLAACVLPGLVTVSIVSGYALLHTHPGELIYGATGLSDTFASIIRDSVFQSPLDFLAPLVFPVLGAASLVWLTYSANRMPALGWIVASIVAATVTIHWIAFRFFGLLLPKDRTAIYFFPLFIVFTGMLTTIPASSRGGRYLRGTFVGALVFMAVYFLSCMRLTYFKEWYWDADVQKAYAILTCLNRERQVTHVASTWSYRGSLNFYQLAEPNSIQEIDENFDPRQTQVYVVDTLHTPGALQGKDLKSFYKGPATDLVLAASPTLAATYASCESR